MKSYYVSKWTDEWMDVVVALPTHSNQQFQNKMANDDYRYA